MMRLKGWVLAGCVGAWGAPPLALGNEPLGRLFFSPAQRAQLDTARATHDRRGPVIAESEPLPPQGPEVVNYSGLVRRNDGGGPSTVWINGKPMTERTRGNDVNVTGVRRDGAVTVVVPSAGRPASLRVGQSMDVASGAIEEPYARRATIPRAADKAAPPAAASTAARAARRETDLSDADSGASPPLERRAKSAK